MAATQQDLPRNTFFSALSAASNGLLLLLVIVAGRVLGDTNYGKFSLALAVASIFEMPIDFGLGTLTVKSVARDRRLAASYLHSILPWKLFMSGVVMLALVPTAYFLTRLPDGRIAIYAMGLAIVLRSMKSTTHSFFRAYERFDLVLLTTYTERLMVLLVCGLLLFSTHALIPFVFAFAIARMPDLALSYWLLHRRVVRVGWRADVSLVRKIQREALPFGSLNVVTVMYAYIGTVILGALRTPAEVGWYSAGWRIYEGLTMFPFILCTVLLPRLSSLYLEDRVRHAGLSARGLKYLLILSLPVMICGWWFAPRILSAVYGPAYIGGAPALRMLFVASVFMSSNWLLNTILVSADKQAVVLKVAAVGLAISASAHIVLVHSYGATGAGVAALFAEIFVFLMFMRLAYRDILMAPEFAAVWRPVVACIPATGVLSWFGSGTPLVSVPIFTGAYLGCLIAVRALDRQEISLIRYVLMPGSGAHQ